MCREWCSGEWGLEGGSNMEGERLSWIRSDLGLCGSFIQQKAQQTPLHYQIFIVDKLTTEIDHTFGYVGRDNQAMSSRLKYS